MAKILLILIVASIIETVGVTYLAKGLKEIEGAKVMTVSEIARAIRNGASNKNIVGGIALEAVFFGALLYMLKVKDMSFVWPLTSLGFIVAALSAHFVLGEKVTATRWAGVALIALGAFLISYSDEQAKSAQGTGASQVRSTPLGTK
ncbi:MAG: EamA family transporter [Limisphaerales bacterium]